MKTISIISFLCLLLGVLPCKAAYSLSADGSTPTIMCSQSGSTYHLNWGGVKPISVEWSVSSGSFTEYGGRTKYTATNESGMEAIYVTWGPASSVNNACPTGVLSAFIVYLSGSTSKTATVTYKQKIQSLKDWYGPDLIIRKKSDYFIPEYTLDMGITNFKVELNHVFYYPGMIKTVNKSEWTLPTYWNSGGNTGTFTSSNAYIEVSTDYFGEGMIKMRGINDCNNQDNSLYSNISIKRRFNFVNYPKEINFGEEQTLTYSTDIVANASYIWDIPADWKFVSGNNTNTITLLKPTSSTNANVRVKLKYGIHESEWYNCPNRILLPPKINIPPVQQSIEVYLSLQISNEKIKTFTITGNGVEILNGQNTNTLLCRFNNSGNIEAEFSLALKESATPYIFKKTINVSKMEISLNEPNHICPYGTQFTNSLPSRFNKIFTVTGNSTARITTSGLLTYDPGQKGSVTVKISVNLEGKDYGSSEKTINLNPHTFSGRYYIDGILQAEEVRAGIFIPRDKEIMVKLNIPEVILNESNCSFNAIGQLDNVRLNYNIQEFSFIARGSSDAEFFYNIDWGCGHPLNGIIFFSVGGPYAVSYIAGAGIINVDKNIIQTSRPSTGRALSKDKFELIDTFTGMVKLVDYLTQNNNQIDVSSIRDGIYIVRITSEETSNSCKIYIKK